MSCLDTEKVEFVILKRLNDALPLWSTSDIGFKQSRATNKRDGLISVNKIHLMNSYEKVKSMSTQ